MPESETESCQKRPSLAISEHSSVTGTAKAIRDWLTSLPQDSPASPSALPESRPEKMTHATCGLQHSNAYGEYDPDSACLRTFQGCLLTDTASEYSGSLPRAGIACDGVFYQQPSWERRISETGSGSWPTPDTQNHRDGTKLRKEAKGRHAMSLHHAVAMWPTPHGFSKDGKSNGPSGNELGRAVNMFPTPLGRDYRSGKGKTQAERGRTAGPALSEYVGGSLNPAWVEWLMGWPTGWTDLKPLAMDKFQQWLEQHGGC